MWWFLPSAVGEHVSPILNPTPTSLPSHPSALSRCTSFECPVSCIELGLMICFTHGNIHVSMLFSQIIPPSPSPTESKSLFFISVSHLLSRIWGHCYHLSKFLFFLSFFKKLVQMIPRPASIQLCPPSLYSFLHFS